MSASPALRLSDPAEAAPALPEGAVRASALRSLGVGASAIQELAAAFEGPLGAAFEAAVERVHGLSGRVIVSGVGKSGHIGRKLAATLASTGTPAFFVHATEASHGDLGMITPDDLVLALSWSGETAELGDLVGFSRRFRVPLVAVTSDAGSTLGAAADIVMALPKVREACPHDLAPTASSLIQLALGDALAIALLERRGFTASHFKVFHPGGKLAARLKTVGQLMHAGEAMPLVPRGTAMGSALLAITGKRFGCVGVTDAGGRLVGIVTNGDLRRHMGETILGKPVEAVMTPDPITVAPALLANAALEMMNRTRITAVFAVEDGRPCGIVEIHDLLRAGVV
jgi:arabinose-5-phosphate isomerase